MGRSAVSCSAVPAALRFCGNLEMDMLTCLMFGGFPSSNLFLPSSQAMPSMYCIEEY